MREITPRDFGDWVSVPDDDEPYDVPRPTLTIGNFWYLVERVNELASEVQRLRALVTPLDTQDEL